MSKVSHNIKLLLSEDIQIGCPLSYSSPLMAYVLEKYKE